LVLKFYFVLVGTPGYKLPVQYCSYTVCCTQCNRPSWW